MILAPWNVPGGSVVSKIAAALAAGASCGKHLQLPSRHTRVTQHRATCPDPYHVLPCLVSRWRRLPCDPEAIRVGADTALV